MGLIGEKFERFLIFDGSLQGIFPYFSERRFSCLSLIILHFFLFFSHTPFFPHTPPQKRQSVPQKGTCAPRAGIKMPAQTLGDEAELIFESGISFSCRICARKCLAAAFCLGLHFANFSLINGLGGRGKSASRLCARKSAGLAGFSSESACSLCLRYCGLVERSDGSEAAGKLRGMAG